MEYCNIKGMRASRIVMGCMRIADKTLPETEKVIVEAMSAGVNTFDLADVYGGGDCERIFGVAVRDLEIPRKDYILQTKCGIAKEADGRITRFDFSKDYILSAVDGCLKRLNTEYIDMLLLHRPDTLVEPEEVAAAFEKLQAEGKVRAFGVSNMSAMQIQLLKSADIHVVANQVQFSPAHTALVDSGFNVNMYKDESVQRAGDCLEYCRVHGIALQAWSPLLYGFFEGSLLNKERFPQLNAELDRLAEKYGCTSAAIVFAWILRHPGFSQVVTGTTSPQHMKELCVAADIKLTREEWYSIYLSTGKVLP